MVFDTVIDDHRPEERKVAGYYGENLTVMFFL